MIQLDDFARDIITTRNGVNVLVDTRYIPWPLGHGYETGVYRCKKGKPDFENEIDCKRYGESKTAADEGHCKMINKWMKETL